jgi:hypothetical protein
VHARFPTIPPTKCTDRSQLRATESSRRRPKKTGSWPPDDACRPHPAWEGVLGFATRQRGHLPHHAVFARGSPSFSLRSTRLGPDGASITARAGRSLGSRRDTPLMLLDGMFDDHGA